jgi:glyoxylase-like metal-dependent hydrolase (beta-lactamase superfamily II)
VPGIIAGVSRSEHGPNLIQLTRFGFVNAYLVREEDGLTLVDTTIAGAAGAIAKAISATGAPLRRLTVTHAHSDHVGSVDALAKRFPGIEIAFPERDARILAGDRSLDPGESGPELRGFRAATFPKIKTRPARTLRPGDRVGSLEVIAAEGHTPGQIAFSDTRDGTLLCADVYATLLGPVTSAKPTLRSPIPAIATWHRPPALESARRLRALDPSRLAPGHGRVVENPASVMDRALATAT